MDEELPMNRRTRSPGICPRLLAGAVLLLFAPLAAHAESLHIHNETTTTVLVQSSCVVSGSLVRNRPYLLNPGDKTPSIVLPGDKRIEIFEAKVPNRVLFRGVIKSSMDDQAFNIVLDGSRLKVEKRKAKRSERP
jgi:hypothetical protein